MLVFFSSCVPYYINYNIFVYGTAAHKHSAAAVIIVIIIYNPVEEACELFLTANVSMHANRMKWHKLPYCIHFHRQSMAWHGIYLIFLCPTQFHSLLGQIHQSWPCTLYIAYMNRFGMKDILYFRITHCVCVCIYVSAGSVIVIDDDEPVNVDLFAGAKDVSGVVFADEARQKGLRSFRYKYMNQILPCHSSWFPHSGRHHVSCALLRSAVHTFMSMYDMWCVSLTTFGSRDYYKRPLMTCCFFFFSDNLMIPVGQHCRNKQPKQSRQGLYYDIEILCIWFVVPKLPRDTIQCVLNKTAYATLIVSLF